MENILEQIDNWFRYHAPKGDQQERYARIRAAAKEFAKILAECTPPSADQTVAIRKLRECVMVANAAIACNESPPI
jgi:alkanesulfonate monooxygenase SsuD/methylene tetrahydromethanopterin reductase-like flavin-dependent oxidoreductase (luciferase family)